MVDIGGDPFAAALEAAPWLVKVNLEEADSILGLEGDPDEVEPPVRSRAARAWSGAARGSRSSPSASTAPRSPSRTGRGGSARCRRSPRRLLGGQRGRVHGRLAGGLAAGDDVVIGLRRAGAAGAANAKRPGQGEIDPADVAAILPGFRVEPVDR